MRVLAVDFGSRNIGLAVGDTDHGIATPRRNVLASGTLAKDAVAVLEVARAEGAEAVVLGVPLDADGENRMSRVCRRLGECIEGLGARVVLVDESFTSASAEKDMVEAGLKGSERRKRSDGEAACRILEKYFEQQKEA